MKRHIGSLWCGLIPAIINRGNNRCATAKEITLGSNCAKETRHFWASGRNTFSSSPNKTDRSCASTVKRSIDGGVKIGAHNSERRETTCSGDDEISERHSVSKNLMRNRLTCDLRISCWTARRAGSSTLRGWSSTSTIERSST